MVFKVKQQIERASLLNRLYICTRNHTHTCTNIRARTHMCALMGYSDREQLFVCFSWNKIDLKVDYFCGSNWVQKLFIIRGRNQVLNRIDAIAVRTSPTVTNHQQIIDVR